MNPGLTTRNILNRVSIPVDASKRPSARRDYSQTSRLWTKSSTSFGHWRTFTPKPLSLCASSVRFENFQDVAKCILRSLSVCWIRHSLSAMWHTDSHTNKAGQTKTEYGSSGYGDEFWRGINCTNKNDAKLWGAFGLRLCVKSETICLRGKTKINPCSFKLGRM